MRLAAGMAFVLLAGCAGIAERGAVSAKVAPYGSWRSPLTAERVAASRIRFEDLSTDGNDAYWIESRPGEGGRNALVRLGADGELRDAVGPEFSVRTRVHQYGGGAYVAHRGTVYFSNFHDHRLYRQARDGAAEALTEPGEQYFADCIVDDARRRLICVREDHRFGEEGVVNALVAIPLDAPGEPQVIASGADFYSNPRLSPDGSRLAWLSWNHPDMPWDATGLWLAEVGADGRLSAPQLVAGGGKVSVFQPEWSPDGQLYFVADESGWWNLHRLEVTGPRNLLSTDAEFGLPQWQFGMRTYAFIDARRVLVSYGRGGHRMTAVLDTQSSGLQPIGSGFEPGSYVAATPTHAYFMSESMLASPGVVRVILASGQVEVIRQAFGEVPDHGYLSAAQPIEFAGSGGRATHAFYYPPRNRDFRAPDGERPPLIVVSHGGPTGAAHPGLYLPYQFWTSRGFAVVDVNYGGSTGYGRAYRERLNGQWGIVDVEDCIAAAQHLVAQGKADPRRLIIRGGSAGGYTTLAALTFHDVFRAGAVYYGVSDAEALARDTHKFESRYLDRLIAPYPEGRETYVARSPIHFTDRLSAPIILFQGLDDKVVPPDQSQRMADAARQRGLPVAYLAFAGEQHGFRQARNIVRAQEAELYFYGAVFGFTPADPIEPVPIDNLPARRAPS